MSKIEHAAELLWHAEQTREPIRPLTDQFDLTAEDAYQIQLKWVERQQQNGRTIIGKKIGLTSKSMQQMMKVNEPDFGHLMDHMVVDHEQVCSTKELIQPKVEAEVAFQLKEDIKGPGVTVADVLRAIEYVYPAIEIIDSRVENWNIKIQDTIADNGSSARIVIGPKGYTVEELDLERMGMVLRKNGKIVATGAGAAALGHPAYAVSWLANKLADTGLTLKKGEIILPGAVAKAVEVAPGDHVTVTFSKIGSVSVLFSE